MLDYRLGGALGFLTQDQDVLGYPRLAELEGLAQAGDGEVPAPELAIDLGGPHGSMAIGVGLDHREDVPLPPDEEADDLEVVTEGIRKNLHARW